MLTEGRLILLSVEWSQHWAIDLSRAFDAFIYSQDSSQSSPLQAGQTPADLFYSYTATKKYVATSGLYVVIKATGDAFMVSDLVRVRTFGSLMKFLDISFIRRVEPIDMDCSFPSIDRSNINRCVNHRATRSNAYHSYSHR